MGTSLESCSPASLLKGSSETLMESSNIISPSSDKRYWSTLRSRVDNLLEHKKPIDPTQNGGFTEGSKRLKEDSMLLLKGFDSVANTLSQLSNNLENALQGARDLARPPTMTEILQCTLERAKNEEPSLKKEDKDEDSESEDEEGKRGLKRKFDPQECSEEESDDPKKELGKLNKAKNLAISMATKAAAMAIELKSVKSDLRFVQERCTLLEEENKKLRDGFSKGIRPEEDDLVRLQLEVLLAEKSRLASENANLVRENRCLHELVEYHQLTSQDLSASYENFISGMCLDFSSPTNSLPEEDDQEYQKNGNGSENSEEAPLTPRAENLQFFKKLDECYEEP